MTFQDQDYYMHKKCRDVAIFVVKVEHVGPDYTKMKIDYINLGYVGHPYEMYRVNNFVVNAEQYDNWLKLIPALDMLVPRTESGLPKRLRDVISR